MVLRLEVLKQVLLESSVPCSCLPGRDPRAVSLSQTGLTRRRPKFAPLHLKITHHPLRVFS